MGHNGSGLQLPGGMEVGPPSVEQLLAAIAQNQVVLARTVDMQLQLQARIALGWDPVEAVRDMGLNVPPVPLRSKIRDKLAEQRAEASEAEEAKT